MASKKKLPNFKLSGSGIKFPIKTLLGGNLTGSVGRQGKKGAKGRIDYRIPIEKVPIIKSLFGYKKKGAEGRIDYRIPLENTPSFFKSLFGYKKKGGKVDRPKGIKIAERGFGKAMKRGK